LGGDWRRRRARGTQRKGETVREGERQTLMEWPRCGRRHVRKVRGL
jgi:hypothetical protein